MQMVKCGDYFQAEDGPREFGNICIVTKWIRTTDTAVVLRHLEVNYIEVRLAFLKWWKGLMFYITEGNEAKCEMDKCN